MKKIIGLIFILSAISILAACSNELAKGESADKGPVLQKGLPEKMSAGMKEYLGRYISDDNIAIPMENGKTIITQTYVFGKKPRMEYYEVTEKDLENKYEELRDTDNPESVFLHLREELKNNPKSIDPLDAGLPQIQAEGEDKFSITTDKGAHTFYTKELSKDKPPSKVQMIRLGSLKDDDLVFEIYNWDERRYNLLLAKRDFSKYTIIEREEGEISKAYADGKFDDYKDLFQQAGSYEILTSGYEQYVFDKSAKKLIETDIGDRFSLDGKQVYLDALTPDEGEQKIFDAETYLNGKEKVAKTFEIDEKSIIKTAKLNGKSYLKRADTEYMSENFIVQELEFGNRIGKDRNMSLIVDLSGKHPQMYLMDFTTSLYAF